MGFEAWFTLAVVVLTVALLAGTRIAPDLVLVGALTLLLISNVLSPAEALSGLSNPGLVTVGALYVSVAGLVDTGAVYAFTRLLGRPRSIPAAQLRLMLPVAAMSGFLNNTPLVAMLVPVVEDWARRCRLAVSKLMLPLSYAAIFGGTFTLIGTSTNLVVHGLVLDTTDLGPMGFFEIGALGLPTAIVGVLIVVETWLARREAAESESGGAPAWVEGELRRYLECGILAHGFARARCAGCGHDLVVAFSCKGRGVCPSCNARRRVEVAAHMVDNVFPRLPVRQWVLSFPKRLRYFLQRDAELAGRVLQVFLGAVEAKLRAASPGAPADARFGGVTFVQRFGSTLNAHLHFHCCLIDGVFAAEGDGMRFYETTGLDEGKVAEVQETVRGRVLDLFARNGLLDEDATANMRGWSHGGGFSLDATIRIEAWDRAGLERLLRYCARPPFASERLSREKRSGRVLYELAKPRPNAPSAITLDPLELIDRLVVLLAPPRIHRHRYHGVLAPNARLRAAVTARANQAVEGVLAIPPTPQKGSEEPAIARAGSAAVRMWAALLARIYEVLPLVCPNCKGEMRLIAFITERTSIEQVLTHIGEPAVPPPIAPARAPPGAATDLDQRLPAEAAFTWESGAEPIPEIQFDQREDW